MKPLASIIIPIASYHRDIARSAIESADGQTVPCEIIAIDDTEKRGVSAIRNEGARRATTPYLVFLDADDILMPDFVLKTAMTHACNRYVYTDYVDSEGIHHQMPDCFPEKGPQLHLNTTFIPKRIFEYVGGYTSDIHFEDSEFYFRMIQKGFCGIRCAEPLVQYRSHHGQRSHNSAKHIERIHEYRSRVTMACCGGRKNLNTAPIGENNPDMVLVECSWKGNYAHTGRATQTVYPANGWYKQAYVYKADAEDGVALLGMAGFTGRYTIIEQAPEQIENQAEFEALKTEIKNLANR